MKRKLTTLILLFSLPFAACIRSVISIPPPPPGGSSSSPTGNMPYSLSLEINGTYTTFNADWIIDSTNNGFTILAGGDSACCTNMSIAWGVNKFDNTPLTTGIYPSQGYLDENESEWTIYVGGQYNTQVGYLAFPDTVSISNVTDSTITGTFWGPCTGRIYNLNDPTIYQDSVLNVTNGKFHLRKW
jgi:hypothetical protein